jgi:NAD(P)-dependent dehydrogenase (short-subunit alcohol dehydrogenase family)
MGKSHQDRVAVITGAAGGLGQAFAVRMAEEGCHHGGQCTGLPDSRIPGQAREEGGHRGDD